MLTPEDSKRVADAMITEIRDTGISLRTTLPKALSGAILTSLGYSYHTGSSPLERAIYELKQAALAALARVK